MVQRWWYCGPARLQSEWYSTISGVFPFGMVEGFQSDLEFKYDGPTTCDDVRLFDGEYHCDVTSNGRTDSSANVITKALCKLFWRCLS